MKKALIPLMVLMSGICSSWATEGYDDLAKLVKSKTSDDIILAFIDVSNVSYAFTADEIIQLKDMGASGKVIAAAIRHKIPGRESEAQKSVAVSAPPAVAAYSGQPPTASPPGDADNYVVYEPEPPLVDYYYYPYSTDFTFYPAWQPNYFYHRYHGYDRGYSGGHGGGGPGGGGQGWHGGGGHGSYKQGGGAQKSRR